MARFTYEIVSDDSGYPDDPLGWTEPTDGRGYYILSRRDYSLPNELDIDFDDFESWDEVAAEVKKQSGFKEPVVKFVRWYEHSGVAISLVDSSDIGGWDVGCAGLICYEKSEESVAEGDFETYAAYVEGDIWGVKTMLDGEEIETVWNYYGYSHAVDSAEEEIAELNKLTDVEIKQRFGRKAGVRATALHK